jgi:hypothetical protein
MAGGLNGRALRDFIGVTGIKMRRMGDADSEPLSSRLAVVLQRLGIAETETEVAARRTAKNDTTIDNDDAR